MAATEIVETRSMFKNRWWIVAASLLGNVVGPGPAVIFTTNVFMLPVTDALHISRGLFSSALLASAVASPILTPTFGNLIDRFGIRRVTLPAIVFYALALCSMSLLSAQHFWLFYVMVFCAAGFGASLGPVVFSKSITAWFDRERGLALGLATCGVGLGTLILPALAEFFIRSAGWRAAYVAVGVTVLILGFTMIALFVREPPGFLDTMRAARAHPATGTQPHGMSTKAAITTTRQFWLLLAIFVIEGTACNGILSGHFVPLLVDRGYTPVAAVALLGTSGLAAMASRIFVGVGLDILNGPVMSALVMLLPPLGVGLLLTHAGDPVPFFAAMFIGLAIGAEMDMLGFFVSRYFGRHSFGTLYGLIFAGFTLGIGVGPSFLGFGHDHFGSYDPILRVFFVALLVAAALFLPLGKYTYPKSTR